MSQATEPAARPHRPGPGDAVSVEEAAGLNDEAFALMQEGRWQEALPLLERAVPALRGTYSDGFRYEAYAEYNLGRTLVELGRCNEARCRTWSAREHLQGERGRSRRRWRCAAARSPSATKVTRRGARRTAAGSSRRYSPDLIGSHQARFSRYHSTVSARPSSKARSRLPAEAPSLDESSE